VLCRRQGGLLPEGAVVLRGGQVMLQVGPTGERERLVGDRDTDGGENVLLLRGEDRSKD